MPGRTNRLCLLDVPERDRSKKRMRSGGRGSGFTPDKLTRGKVSGVKPDLRKNVKARVGRELKTEKLGKHFE
jgi:hypothetical protein